MGQRRASLVPALRRGSVVGSQVMQRAVAGVRRPAQEWEREDESGWAAALPYRREIRRFHRKLWVEQATITFMLSYLLLVLLDLVLDDIDEWRSVFIYVDVFFLLVFVIEHAVRFYAFGLEYMCIALAFRARAPLRTLASTRTRSAATVQTTSCVRAVGR